MGFDKRYTPLRNLVMRWWSSKVKNDVHKLMFQATPIFIFWNLWKNICAGKNGDKPSNISRVKYAVFKDIFNLLTTTYLDIKWPSNWKDLIIMVEGCSH